MSAAIDASAVRAVLLDVEGTTTPADFVYKTLFPYARERIQGFLERHAADAAVQADLELLEQEHAGEDAGAPGWSSESHAARLESAVQYVHWLMDLDRKSTALKALQGRVWQEGFEKEELRGAVYPDVPPALARWRAQGRDVAVFSSGSVLAQKLLFARSTAGDLTPYFRAHFDTTTGPKREAASYARIALELGLPPRTLLFLSDVVAELDAARAAGVQTALCVRPGNATADGAGHARIRSFDEVLA